MIFASMENRLESLPLLEHSAKYLSSLQVWKFFFFFYFYPIPERLLAAAASSLVMTILLRPTGE